MGESEIGLEVSKYTNDKNQTLKNYRELIYSNIIRLKNG